MDLWKRAPDLTAEDLQAFPVWEYVNRDDLTLDETVVEPVRDLPVRSLRNRVVGTRVRLHNGHEHWALLSNVSLNNPRQTEQFLFMSIIRDQERLSLARYFDSNYDLRGPAQVAAFLGLPLEDVFPISYDLSEVALGRPEVVRGAIKRVVGEQLSSSERIALVKEPD